MVLIMRYKNIVLTALLTGLVTTPLAAQVYYAREQLNGLSGSLNNPNLPSGPTTPTPTPTPSATPTPNMPEPSGPPYKDERFGEDLVLNGVFGQGTDLWTVPRGNPPGSERSCDYIRMCAVTLQPGASMSQLLKLSEPGKTYAFGFGCSDLQSKSLPCSSSWTITAPGGRILYQGADTVTGDIWEQFKPMRGAFLGDGTRATLVMTNTSDRPMQFSWIRAKLQ